MKPHNTHSHHGMIKYISHRVVYRHCRASAQDAMIVSVPACLRFWTVCTADPAAESKLRLGYADCNVTARQGS